MSTPITFPAPPGNWGTITTITMSGRFVRHTPKDIRRCRYERRYRREAFRRAGSDAGSVGCRPFWFICVKVDQKPVSDATEVGCEEGDRCNRNGCTGTLEFEPVENCCCHIAPPCGACTDVRLYCEACDWRDGDDDE